MIVEKINSPADLKDLDLQQLNALAEEIRQLLLKRTSKLGGHVGGNLGVVECTIALHKVFNSPIDKIVFDVSHQSYTHKILTGRRAYFENEELYGRATGYTNPAESEHDIFTVGHTSTSVSLACGLARARDLANENYNVIAFIGDGSLSGGEALEGLDFAGEYDKNLIIVVNDNGMSIAENHGGIYKNLKLLRESEGKCELNFFNAIGLDYLFVKDGNDLRSLINAFQSIKDCSRPTVVHVCTQKGKGYAPAEEDKESWHWHPPFDIQSNKNAHSEPSKYISLLRDYLLEKIKKDPKIAIICAGTPGAIGFSKQYRKSADNRFIDVGIAEEHAIAMASAMAKNGAKPIVCIQSSFLQRCYDQLSQDLCLNNGSAVIFVYSASIRAMQDVTHLGIFDVALTCNIPNMTCLNPTNAAQLVSMADWAIDQQGGPVVIRVPVGEFVEGESFRTEYGEKKYQLLNRGRDIAIISLGNCFGAALSACEQLRSAGYDPTLIDAVYSDFVDTSLVLSLLSDHSVFVTVEDGCIEGGFGQKLCASIAPYGVRAKALGIEKRFIDRFCVDQVLRENKLTASQICKTAIELITNK